MGEAKAREGKALKGVLFDLDGTILDTHDLLLASFRHAVHEVLGPEGDVIPDERLMAKVGQPLDTQLWDFANGSAQTHEQLCTTYRAYNHRVHDERVRPFPGIPQALEALHDAGLRIAVVTSKRHALAAHGLELFGLDKFVEFVIGPDDWPEAKPEPGPVLHGCDLMGLDPAQCAYVGDSPFDMQAGNGAGCLTVAVMWGMFAPEVLEAEHPALICKAPADLPGLLLG